MKHVLYTGLCLGSLLVAGDKLSKTKKKSKLRVNTVWDALKVGHHLGGSDKLEPPSGNIVSKGQAKRGAALYPEEEQGLLDGYVLPETKALARSTYPEQDVFNEFVFTVKDALAFKLPIARKCISDRGIFTGPYYAYQGLEKNVSDRHVAQFLQAIDGNDELLLKHLLITHPSLARGMYGNHGLPALIYAVWHGKKKSVRCLLEHKADPACMGKNVLTTPLECAEYKRHKAIRAMIKKALKKH